VQRSASSTLAVNSLRSSERNPGSEPANGLIEQPQPAHLILDMMVRHCLPNHWLSGFQIVPLPVLSFQIIPPADCRVYLGCPSLWPARFRTCMSIIVVRTPLCPRRFCTVGMS